MQLLALDLGTELGYCVGAGERNPRLGSIALPQTGEEVGPYLDFFFRWLNHTIEDERPEMLLFEAPILPESRWDAEKQKLVKMTNITTTRKLQGMAGLCEMIAVQQKIECREVHLQTAKKTLGGSGRSEKDDMMRSAKRCGMAPRTFDEADAFGVWLVGVKHYSKEFWNVWDAKLWAQRGLI